MTERPLNDKQRHALKLIVETHGGCFVNLHTARVLQRRGLVVPPVNGNLRVPQPTNAARALVAEWS